MKKSIKLYIIAQIIFILSAVVFGAILDTNGSETTRALHRLSGMLAVISSIASSIALFTYSSTSNNTKLKIISLLTVVAILTAGFAGASLKSTNNYQLMYDLMRTGGFIALILSVTMLAFVRARTNQ